VIGHESCHKGFELLATRPLRSGVSSTKRGMADCLGASARGEQAIRDVSTCLDGAEGSSRTGMTDRDRAGRGRRHGPGLGVFSVFSRGCRRGVDHLEGRCVALTISLFEKVQAQAVLDEHGAFAAAPDSPGWPGNRGRTGLASGPPPSHGCRHSW